MVRGWPVIPTKLRGSLSPFTLVQHCQQVSSIAIRSVTACNTLNRPEAGYSPPWKKDVVPTKAECSPTDAEYSPHSLHRSRDTVSTIAREQDALPKEAGYSPHSPPRMQDTLRRETRHSPHSLHRCRIQSQESHGTTILFPRRQATSPTVPHGSKVRSP